MGTTLSILSCGIFQPELDKLLSDVRQDLRDCDVEIRYASPGLHVNNAKLEAGIAAGLEPLKEKNVILLYGAMCHPDLARITGGYAVVRPQANNCIELLLDPQRKQELDATGNLFYMTAGWLKYWREIFQTGQGWDPIDARLNFGVFDKILVLDSGCYEMSDEDILEFFDYTQVPIEFEAIDLNYMKGVVLELCRQAADG